MFLEPRLVRAANEWVDQQEDRDVPVFRREVPGLVTVNGGILRFSTTTPERAKR